MNKLFVIAALALTAQGFAATNKNTQPKKPYQEGDRGLNKNEFPAAYNAPAAVQVDGWDVALFGSFIYWHASQDYMDIGSSTSTSADATTITADIANQKFKYAPGFKAGLSFNATPDYWSFGAQYTWLHETVSQTFQAPTTASAWNIDDWFLGVSPDTDNTLSTSWKLHFNLVDAYATRPFYQGRFLTITPRGGIRALWIKQELDVASGTASSAVTSKNWMLGPNVGMDTHWLLGCGVRIESITNVSILYTRFTKVSLSDTIFAGGPTEQASLKNLNSVTPVLEAGLGLGWGTYFANNGAHFDLSARYDFMYLWNQNVLRNLVGASFNESKPVGDLALQGLTVNVRFDF